MDLKPGQNLLQKFHRDPAIKPMFPVPMLTERSPFRLRTSVLAWPPAEPILPVTVRSLSNTKTRMGRK